MIVADAVGAVLAAAGARVVFGVVGSGNFHVTNALVRHGARFVAARHEGGAATMADAYARMSGRVGVVTVHQGPGLTNAVTGIAEAAKSRTPLVVLTGEATDPRSNFHLDQDALARSVGAVARRLTSPATAAAEALEAFLLARDERRTVLLNLPLDLQSADPGDSWQITLRRARTMSSRPEEAHRAEGRARAVPSLPEEASPAGAQSSPAQGSMSGEGALDAFAGLLRAARRPVFVAGRGARHARAEVEELAGRAGALLATSAVARGLFRGSPWDLDVSGGFATPLAAELIRDADLVVGWGCALNMWTTRHGTLIGPGAKVVQVDLEHAAVGRHVRADLGVVGDVARVARAAGAALAPTPEAGRYRSPEVARRIREEGRWRAVPYRDESGGGRIDPRTLSIGLDDLLPAERIVAPDSGNFMGYPAMFIDVPDEAGFCFTQAFQAVGLGLASAIGAAVARPDRLPVAALGDGGAWMSAAELETVVRLGLPMVVVVYDDEAYGAEVHHFGPGGDPLDTVRFPPADLAAVARGHGFTALTVTDVADLAGVADWLKGPRDRPLMVHAKVTREHPSWWLEDAFRGH